LLKKEEEEKHATSLSKFCGVAVQHNQRERRLVSREMIELGAFLPFQKIPS